MDNYPKTSFICSPDTEIERVVHACKVSSSGFYARHGFVVSDQVIPEFPEATVVVPKLDYASIPGFWEQISSLPLQFPLVMPDSLRLEVGKLLRDQELVSSQVISARQQEWEHIETGFFSELDKTLMSERQVVGEIEVRLTRYGTISSFSFLSKRVGQKLIIYLRSDASVSQLAEAILTAILYPIREEAGLSWSKREAIVDFWLSRSGIAQYLPDYKPTLLRLGRIPQSVRKQSARYTLEIGIPQEESELEKLRVGMSKKESEVFGLLFARQGEIVSFDAIADFLWGEGEFLTFWAINKLMQRVRRKLVGLGFSKSCLITKRGRGYILQLGSGRSDSLTKK